MNTTLTTIAAVLVLALAAALIGPHFVDWTRYRAEFEARASEIVGAPVTVRGEVDARLLPNPSIRFRDVVIGAPGETARLEVDEFALRLSPAPLLKGDVHVRDVEVAGSRLTLEIGPDGEVAFPFDPAGTRRVDLARVTLDRVGIDGGSIILSDPEAGRRIEISGVSGTGSAVSLMGPFKFDGQAAHQGQNYSVRLATGRFGTGQTQTRLDITSLETQQNLSLDGNLGFAALKPTYQGRLTVGRALGKGTAENGDTWLVSGIVAADPREVRFDDLDVQYGPDERALRLEGFGEIALGLRPRAHLNLSARQLDLDRLLGPSATPRRPDEVLAMVRSRLPAPSAAIPLTLDMAVDGVLIAGELVQDVTLSAAQDQDGLHIEKAYARLPGAGRVAAAGRLLFAADADTRFDGRVEADIGELPLLLRWIGREDAFPGVRKLALTGTLEAERLRASITDARLSVDGESAEGRVLWRRDGDEISVSTTIKAERLDLDAINIIGLYRSLGGKGHAPPGLELTLDAEEVRYLGLSARQVSVDMAVRRDEWTVSRFAFGDLGGSKIDAAGDLTVHQGKVKGLLKGRIEANRLDGLARFLRDTPVPDAVSGAFARHASALAPMNAAFGFGAEDGGGIVLTAAGEAGGSRLDLRIGADRFDRKAVIDANVGILSRNANRFLAQLGLPVVALEAGGEGSMTLTAQGSLAERVKTSVEVSMLGGSLSLDGDLRSGTEGITGALDLSTEMADVTPLLSRLGRLPPVSLAAAGVKGVAQLVIAQDRIAFEAIEASVAGRAVEGQMAFSGVGLRIVSGALSLDRLDIEDLVMLAIGPLAIGETTAAGWPDGPPSPGLLAGLAGSVGLKVAEARLDALAPLREIEARLVFVPDGLAVEDVRGRFADGRFEGALGIQTVADKIALRTRFGLTDTDLAGIAWHGPDGMPLMTGRVDLMADVAGSGDTLAQAVAGLNGGGTVAARGVTVERFDLGAFELVRNAAEAGLDLTAGKVAGAFESALARGALNLREATGAFSVAGGVLRLSNLVIDAPTAWLSAAVTADLAKASLNASVGFGPRGSAGDEGKSPPRVSLIFDGPLDAPERRLDVTALTGFLTALAIDREVGRIEALESEAHERGRLRREADVQALRRQMEEADEVRRAARRADEEARRIEAERIARETVVPALPPPREVGPPPGASSPGSIVPFNATGSIGEPRPAGGPLVITPQPQQATPNALPRTLRELFR